jgi:hypothetical protein
MRPIWLGLGMALTVVSCGSPVPTQVPTPSPQTTASGPATSTQTPTPTQTTNPTTPPAALTCVDAGNPGIPVSLVDMTGTVVSCSNLGEVDYHIFEHVTNPDGQPSTVRIQWGRASCIESASATLRREIDAFIFEVTNGPATCQFANASAEAIDLKFAGPVPANMLTLTMSTVVTPTPTPTPLPPLPTPKPATDNPVLSRARWNLAPDELALTTSTQLRVIVQEQGCSSGQQPVLFGEPFVFYEPDSIAILFSILSLPWFGDCQPAPGIPATITLKERLGHRVLYDMGGNGQVLRRINEIPIFWSDPLGDAASQRVRLMAGPGACESSIEGDRVELAPDELRAIDAEVNWRGGPVDHRQAYVGSWFDASQFFGAIETYQNGSLYNAIVATIQDLGISDPKLPVGSLVLTRLQDWYLPTGQQVWYPAYLFQAFSGARVFHSPPCQVS